MLSCNKPLKLRKPLAITVRGEGFLKLNQSIFLEVCLIYLHYNTGILI